MAHNVENMFSVKQTPWHGLGSVIADAPTIAEGIELAGLNWSVKESELVRRDILEERLKRMKDAEGHSTGLFVKADGSIDLDALCNGATVCDDAKAWYRDDTSATLGIVGPMTHPLQNRFAFNMFQPFLDAGEASLETAGCLDEGRKIWVLAQLNKEPLTIKGDDAIRQYLMLSNSHDGTMAVRIGFTPIRIVCANTLAMAHKAKDSKLVRIRHSIKVEANVENVRDVIETATASFNATAEQFRLLANKDINAKDLAKYVKVALGVQTMAQAEAGEIILSTRSRNIVDNVIGKFENGKGHELAGKTWWGAYNALTEYLNYDRGHKAETKLNSLWFGDNFKKNADSLKLALELAA